MVLLVTSPQCDHSNTIYCFPTVFKRRAVPKRDDDDKKTTAPLLLQENVFIEASRPKYLEDLHSEALEGLKFKQQEERVFEPEYTDNESTISTVSARAEVDGGFTTDSTLPDTSSMVSVKSSVSTRSSRSGLTRQGSTFRPLNSEKKSDKGRTRRKQRRTIGGIPQHLQREFGLDRAEWTVTQEEEPLNGESNLPQLAVHSPTETDSSEVIEPLEQIRAQPAHTDDMTLLQHVETVPPGGDRPWSLAVPGMTTAGSGPPSPVMSISPQAAYLSKIIPNAVLPPSIEVVEISRGSSRNSVRTVSKSSLMMSSPPASRPSSRASTARSTSSKSTTITSASRQKHFHLSDSSCWSNSDSDTLVSDSSTISSSSAPGRREAQDKEASKKQNKVGVHTDLSKGASNGRMIKGDDSKKDETFVRSLSVMKPKRAPPPPSRSYSLHNKMKRRSRDLADVKIVPSPASEGNKKKIDSPGYNADTSSLDESTGSKSPSPLKSQQNVDVTNSYVSTNAKKEENFNYTKIISPSSGYSSQDATSPNNSSPKDKKGLLARLHKLFPVPAPTHPESAKTSNVSVTTADEKPSVTALRELFSVPPHPKVHAPPPPPPEVWSHSPRSIELLLGPPASQNAYAIVKKNPKDKRPYRQPPSTCAEGGVRSFNEEQRQSSNAKVESKKVHVSQEGSLNVFNSERLIQTNVKEQGKVQVSATLNEVLVRTVERDGQRLPAIAEEHKSSTQKYPSISSAHISPRLPIKQTAVVPIVVTGQQIGSPESSWPPPPPPVSQAGLGSPEETELPLPPPPIITENEIVLSVQVPSDNPVPSSSDQQCNAPPLNIPPPPSYTAPAPPTKTLAFSEKLQLFSSHAKQSSPPSLKTISSAPNDEVKPHRSSEPSPSSLPKITPAATEIYLSKPAESTPAPKISVILSPPEAPPPPPQKQLIIHAPSSISTVSPSNSNVPPPPDLIPPSPSKTLVILPSIVADLPSQAAPQSIEVIVSPPPTDVTSESKEDISKSVITNVNSLPASEIVTEVSIHKPADPPPALQIVSQLPCEDLNPPSQTTSSSVKEISPAPPENLPPTLVEVTSPPEEVTIVSPEVSVSPSEETSASIQIQVTHVQIESPEVSIPVDVTPQPSKELSTPQEVLLPQDLPPQHAEVMSEEPPPSKEEPVPSSEIKVSETDKLQAPENSPPVVEEEAVSTREETHCDPSASDDSVLASEEPVTQIEDEILTKTDLSLPPWKSILTPPQSIPPPPPTEQPSTDTLPSAEQNEHKEDASKEPKEESPPQPENPPTELLLHYKNQIPFLADEKQAKEPIPASTESENHCNDQTVNGDVDSPKAEEPKSEVTTKTQEHVAATQVQTSTTNEAPQKPIRKSLIIISTTIAPSMNLQEAIRLRTAARSQNGPSSRLGLHSPPGFDVRKSPTSTASFIFSKSNKKVVIDARSEAKTEKKTDVPVTKASLEQTVKKEFKKPPPPVAKKPKAKSIEAETEGTAGQTDVVKDNAKKPNGTAGTVEGQ
ncbi:hypothetical protein WMY93_017625 [Mugilogobius chulae]|uniref:KIAA1522 n=1 Tax=Mugilogobius chulae TaxID=88201 RepID=A0AAW0NPW1_9GOBI